MKEVITVDMVALAAHMKSFEGHGDPSYHILDYLEDTYEFETNLYKRMENR